MDRHYDISKPQAGEDGAEAKPKGFRAVAVGDMEKFKRKMQFNLDNPIKMDNFAEKKISLDDRTQEDKELIAQQLLISSQAQAREDLFGEARKRQITDASLSNPLREAHMPSYKMTSIVSDLDSGATLKFLSWRQRKRSKSLNS